MAASSTNLNLRSVVAVLYGKYVQFFALARSGSKNVEKSQEMAKLYPKLPTTTIYSSAVDENEFSKISLF